MMTLCKKNQNRVASNNRAPRIKKKKKYTVQYKYFLFCLGSAALFFITHGCHPQNPNTALEWNLSPGETIEIADVNALSHLKILTKSDRFQLIHFAVLSEGIDGARWDVSTADILGASQVCSPRRLSDREISQCGPMIGASQYQLTLKLPKPLTRQSPTRGTLWISAWSETPTIQAKP